MRSTTMPIFCSYHFPDAAALATEFFICSQNSFFMRMSGSLTCEVTTLGCALISSSNVFWETLDEPRSLDVAHGDLLSESVHSLLRKCCRDVGKPRELFVLGELELRPQSAKVLVPLLLGSPMKYSFAGGISSTFSNS